MKRGLKVLGKVFLGFIVLIIAVVLGFSWFVKANNKDYGDHNQVLTSEKQNAKKALVVYQPSRGKTTNKIAESLAKGINQSGYEVTINYPGKHMSKDISQYSIVVFGSPVYIGKTSTTLSDYMKSIKISDSQKVLVFVTGGELSNGELDKVETQLGSRKATEKVGFKNGEKDESKAYEVGKKIGAE